MQQGVMIALPTTPRYKEKYMRNIDAANAARAFAADTAPSYISPVLLRFIASNAPLELDVFNELLSKSSSNSHLQRERHSSKKGNARKDPIEALLSTIREYNKLSEQSPRGSEQQGPTQQSEKNRKGPSERPAPSCARCAEKFAKECGEKGCNKSIDKVGIEKGRQCSKEWVEKHTKEFSNDKGRTSTKEFSKECSEKPRTCSRECAEKYRPGTGRVKHLKLPIRPLSARDDNRMRETNLPERPRSARDSASMGSAETSTRKTRGKRRLRPFSPREREQENASRETELQRPVLSDVVRPASAGSCGASERAKPMWFRQASLKALQALEKTLLAKLQLCTEHGDSWSLSRSRSCGKSHDMEQNSTSVSKLKSCARKEEDTPRPGTAPAASSQRQTYEASLGQNRESLSPRRRKPVDIEDLQQAGVAVCEKQVDFPITRKFVETSIEKNSATAPSSCDSSIKTPRKDRQTEVKDGPTKVKAELTGRSEMEDDDDFKDYIQHGVESYHDKDDEDFPSSCSSDYENEDIDDSNTLGELENKQLAIDYDKADDAPVESCIIQLKQTGHVSPEEGVSDLFRGVHESLLVSSKLAEVVDLCCKRGQELLRARESMAIEKPPEKGRWPFKLHRSKQSRANRRALRAELKWSIFSNGGKMRALNPIYGGGKRYLSNRIGFVSAFPEIL